MLVHKGEWATSSVDHVLALTTGAKFSQSANDQALPLPRLADRNPDAKT